MNCPDEEGYKEIIEEIQSGTAKSIGAGGFGEVFHIRDYIIKRIEIADGHDNMSYHNEVQTWMNLSQNPEMKQYMPAFCFAKRLDRPPMPEVDYSSPNKLKVQEQLKQKDIWITEHGHEPQAVGFIFQKYEEVKDLYKLIYEEWAHNKLSGEEGYALIIELCKAFDILHKSGYIHRDIKPENILIKGNMQPIIIDFGLACAVPCQDTYIKGTTAYLNPNIKKQLLNNNNRPNSVCEFPVKQKHVGFFNRIKSMLPCSRARRILKTRVHVKLTNKVALPQYNRASDRYSLSLVLQELVNVIDWSYTPELKIQAGDIIRKYRAEIIPFLASSIAKQEGGKRGKTRRRQVQSHRKKTT